MKKQSILFALAGLGVLVGGVALGSATSNLTNTTPDPVAAASCAAGPTESASDGPDQGPDANATEPGHQDANDAGDTPEGSSCETEAPGAGAESDGVDHQYDGEEDHAD